MGSFATRQLLLHMHQWTSFMPSSAAASSATLLQTLKTTSVTSLISPWQQFTSLIPSIADILLAVPKRKVTPHRKGKRSANKHLRFVPVVSQCSKCERVFPQHSMPSKCDEDECPAFNVRKKPANTAAAEEQETTST